MSVAPRHRWLLVALALSAGCRAVDPAPEDLEGLLHWFWERGDAADDPELSLGRDNLHELLGDELLDDPLDGSTASLTDAEVLVAGLDHTVDPSEAAGMWIASGMDCTLALAEDIVTSLDQDVLYDIYDHYERVYTSDDAAFASGATDTLTWDITYGATVPLSGPYTAQLTSSARRVEADGDTFLLFRSVLVEPAVFERNDGVFDQDYRIEVYYAPRDGRVRHVEALWRHMDAGMANTDNASVQRLILNGLGDWDEQTAAWCESGLP